MQIGMIELGRMGAGMATRSLRGGVERLVAPGAPEVVLGFVPPHEWPITQ